MHTASDFAPTPPRITLPAALVAFARALAVYGAQIKAAERAFDTMPDGYDDDNAQHRRHPRRPCRSVTCGG